MGSHRGLRRLILAGLCAVAVVASPAIASARVPSLGYTVTAARSGSVSLTLAHRGRFQVAMSRPSERARYAAVEITRSVYSGDSYYAFAWSDGTVLSGQQSSTSASATGSSAVGFGPPARELDLGSVTLPAGHYTVTLVAHEKMTLTLLPSTGGGRTVRLRADHPTDASETSRSFSGSAMAGYAERSLPVTVPVRSHVLLLVAQEEWTGTSTIGYVDSCVSAPTAGPCPPDVTLVPFSVQPTADPGQHRAVLFGIWQEPPSGVQDAYFYSAVTGAMNDQELTAIALP